MKSKNKNRQLGFTLLELLVVISILGMLASIILVNATNARAKSRDVRRQADLYQIGRALYLYDAKYGVFPGDPTQWYNSNTGNFLPELISENLMARKPLDPINNDRYFYSYTPSTGGVCPDGTRALLKYYAEVNPYPGYRICFFNDPGYIGQCLCIP